MERYEKVRILGRGSFGVAILVRPAVAATAPWLGDGCQTVAPATASALRVVKEVHLDLLEERRRAEALREAEVLKSLSHPNIIAYEEAILVNTQLCIVMEYADGGDLGAAIERRRTAGWRRYHEREVVSIFGQLAMALEHIHARRILHRDLKSQNIFLTSAGVPKIGDFGIARVLEASEICAATKIGTPHYLSPEMCDNSPYDFKADVWCLGVILYEMLALEVPFSGQSIANLVVKICTAEPRPVPAIYSCELRILLSRMLSKRAEDRPSSSEIAAMPHVRRGIPTSARRPSSGCDNAVADAYGGYAPAPITKASASRATTAISPAASTAVASIASEDAAAVNVPVASGKSMRSASTKSVARPFCRGIRRHASVPTPTLERPEAPQRPSEDTVASVGAETTEALDSPKRARTIAQKSCPKDEGPAMRGPTCPLVRQRLPPLTVATAAPLPKWAAPARVSSAELLEAGLDVDPLSPVDVCTAAPPTTTNPRKLDLSIVAAAGSSAWDNLSPSICRLEQSGSCLMLLRELEKELNLAQ